MKVDIRKRRKEVCYVLDMTFAVYVQCSGRMKVVQFHSEPGKIYIPKNPMKKFQNLVRQLRSELSNKLGTILVKEFENSFENQQI